MLKNDYADQFDVWYARHLSRQIENRSGILERVPGPRPQSWGECQDYNASRMKTLNRPLHEARNPLWESTALKSRLQIDRRGKNKKDRWYDQEYRMSFQINKRAYEVKPLPCLPIWEARAVYEVCECNLRARRFHYGQIPKILTTWRAAFIRAFSAMYRPRPNLEDYQGRQHDPWELLFRHAKLRFSHAPPIEDSWFRAVKSKLMRPVASESLTLNAYRKNTSAVPR
jgi:hypothetical protein